MSNPGTPVVFRVWTGRFSGVLNVEVFALFPTICTDSDGRFCSSYERIGGHSSADYFGCIADSRPAAPKEYADLKVELKRRGYTLRVIKRATKQHHEMRKPRK